MHIHLKRVASSVIYLRIRLCSSPNSKCLVKVKYKILFLQTFS